MADDVAIRFILQDDDQSSGKRTSPTAPGPTPGPASRPASTPAAAAPNDRTNPQSPSAAKSPVDNSFAKTVADHLGAGPLLTSFNQIWKVVAGAAASATAATVGMAAAVVSTAKVAVSVINSNAAAPNMAVNYRMPGYPNVQGPIPGFASNLPRLGTSPIPPGPGAMMPYAQPGGALVPVARGAGALANNLGAYAPNVTAASGFSLGPVAIGMIGVAAAVAANFVIGKAGSAARSGIEGASNLAQSVAKGDAVGVIEKTTNAFAGFMGYLGPAGKLVGEFSKTMATGIRAVDNVSRAFLSRGNELAAYSPQIAAAQGRQSLREVRTDLREAGVLGDKYARLQDNYGALQEKLATALLGVKSVLLDILSTILEWANKLIETIKEYATTIMALGDMAVTFTSMFPIVNAAVRGAWEIVKVALAKFINDGNADMPDPLKQFFDLLLPANQPNFTRDDPMKDAAKARLNIPAFAGL